MRLAVENKNFERELPEGYSEVKHIDAKNLKFGIIFNLIAIAVAVIVCTVGALLVGAFVPESSFKSETDSIDPMQTAAPLGFIIGFLCMLVYIVLHELVHGMAYKRLTGERLTFGITWSAAFCGVPNIYVYRRASIIACAAPLLLFSAILIPLGVVMLALAASVESFAALVAFVAVTVVFAFHLGGCSGDVYVILLFLTKFKDKRALIRDTGPAQSFYMPSSADETKQITNGETL